LDAIPCRMVCLIKWGEAMKFTGINLLDEFKRPELAEFRAVFHERSFTRGHVIYHPD